MGSAILKIIRVQLYKLWHGSYFTIPYFYSFTMYSLRGTWSVGFADWFSLWVVFYVYDEWFMGKLRGSLDFQVKGFIRLSAYNSQTKRLNEEDFRIF